MTADARERGLHGEPTSSSSHTLFNTFPATCLLFLFVADVCSFYHFALFLFGSTVVPHADLNKLHAASRRQNCAKSHARLTFSML